MEERKKEDVIARGGKVLQRIREGRRERAGSLGFIEDWCKRKRESGEGRS